MKPKPLGFHKTEGANDHIEQSYAFLFTRHSIGVTNDQLAAMLTHVLHMIPLKGKEYAISD
jgi:hypothetical protein